MPVHMYCTCVCVCADCDSDASAHVLYVCVFVQTVTVMPVHMYCTCVCLCRLMDKVKHHLVQVAEASKLSSSHPPAITAALRRASEELNRVFVCVLAQSMHISSEFEYRQSEL